MHEDRRLQKGDGDRHGGGDSMIAISAVASRELLSKEDVMDQVEETS
jgi:hypothetical protein